MGSTFYRFYRLINRTHGIEECYYVSTNPRLEPNDLRILESIVGNNLSATPHITPESLKEFGIIDELVERGPKLWIQSEWGSNAKTILGKSGVDSIIRIERFMRGPRKLITKGIDEMVENVYKEGLQQFNAPNVIRKPTGIVSVKCDIDELKKYSDQHSLGFTDEDIEWYFMMWKKQKRKIITELELHDLAQSNSEHSRHHIFGADMYLENETKTFTRKYSHTLFDLVKLPLKTLKTSKTTNSTLAFCDNSSAIDGFDTQHLIRVDPTIPSSSYYLKNVHTNTLFTAETHNFPTGIAPFPGAATGIGGRIRDAQAIGRGGMFVASAAGYCVSSLGIPHLSNIENGLHPKEYLHSGANILIQASNGASDYGNKVGEPIIQGFTRSFGMTFKSNSAPGSDDADRRIEWIKPIMFTSGIGMVYAEHLHKKKPKTGMLIGRVGGPAYRIGVGGGTASSTSQTSENSDQYQSSVQRGDPEMEQKMDRFIRACIEMGDDNPIISIHDQGAGGMCNVTKEIVETEKGTKGAIIDIRKVVCGDDTMTLKELWIAEYQEQNTFLTRTENVEKLKRLASREGVPLTFVGNVTNDGIFTVHDTLSTEPSRPIVEFKLSELNKLPKKKFVLPFVDAVPENIHTNFLSINKDLTVESMLNNVLKHPSVCSKRFLTNKVDRSVSGLIAQQQCVGPLHTPLADVAIISHSHFGVEGAATSIGEKPITGIICPDKMARMAVGEMVMNMAWAKIEGLQYVKCSGNWMWPATENREKRKMLLAARALSDIMCEMELSIDGGKDSLSMSSTTRVTNKRVDSPPQLVISGYTGMRDITKKVTPDLKTSGNGLLYINIHSKYRLGGSILVQTFNSDNGLSGLSGFFANDYPDVDNSSDLVNVFKVIQALVEYEWIESGHDVSDGGMITTVLEMAFAGDKGLRLNIDTSDALCTDNRFKRSRWISVLFSEELGCVIEVPWKYMQKVKGYLAAKNVYNQYIGYVTNDNIIELKLDNEVVFDNTTSNLRDVWESTSFELEKMQSNIVTVNEERKNLLHVNHSYKRTDYGFHCTDRVWQSLYSDNCTNVSLRNSISNRPRVGIIREEGSNGDREMCAAFWSAGFEPYDIMTSDMISPDSKINLKNFSGIVFVGGFTFSDVFGAAKGWESIIKQNECVRKQFEWFYSDKNTTRFSLGVCNGCQLMCRMGWVGIPFEGEKHVSIPQQNSSGRFESRFVKLKILPSNSVLLKDMSGCNLGTWVAHGEGRFGNSNSELKNFMSSSFPLRYIDEQLDNLMYTDQYPENPNGSAYGIAGAISKNGLHLAMMPHPERCIKSWQNPWYPKNWQSNIDASYDGRSMPWEKLFKNAFEFVNKK